MKLFLRQKKMKIIVRLTSTLFAMSCTSVKQEGKKETLERVLRVEEETKISQAKEPDEKIILTPAATPAALGATLPSGIADKPAPNVVQPSNLNLPLPRGYVHADLFHFLNAHADIMSAYHPLSEEWVLYSKLFAAGSKASGDEITGLRARIRENLARTHWLFVWGVFQSSSAMLSPQKSTQLIMDRQQDFIERINVLVFLMTEMQSAGMRADHRGFLRDFYKHMNAKHFRRPLRDRPAKPLGTLRP